MRIDNEALNRKLFLLTYSRKWELLMLALTLFFGFCTSMMVGNLINAMTGVYSELGDEVWKMYLVTILGIGVYGALFWWFSKKWLSYRDMRLYGRP